MGRCKHVWTIFIRHKSVSFITVENVRIGLTLRAAQIAIFAYACVSIFDRKQFFYEEAPNGYSNSWMSDFAIPDSPSSYCSNASFDFVYAEGWEYLNNSCREFLPGEVAQKMPDGGLYMQTYVQERFIEVSGCDFSGLSCANSSEIGQANVFVPGIEDASIGIDHAYHTSFRSEKDVKLSLLDQGGKTLEVFGAGNSISISVRDALKAAGIEGLDENNPDAYIADSFGNAVFRLSGILLIFDISYGNKHTMTGDEVLGTLKISNSKTGFAGTGAGNDVLHRNADANGTFSFVARDYYSYGIKVKILYSGTIGKPSVFAALDSLVTYSVLLAFAGILADFTAEYLTPEVAEVFRAKKREPLSGKPQRGTSEAKVSVGNLADTKIVPS